MLAASSAPPSAPASSDDALPRSFGRYTLFELIGKGGMAQIYLARAETELGATRLAVVKQILPAFADDPRFAEMLVHEAKLAARLGHTHIVQVFDLGRAGERDDLFIAMEYVEGFDLNALLRQCTEKKVGLPAPHALGIIVDVLEGLDYAHRRTDDDGAPLGIVHRDVSPSNVLISFDGEVKLCDFGIAHANKLVKEDASEALKGKAGYMSPEHARGEAVDARSDVFAAGILLWELLAGRRLYKTKSELPLIEQARRAEIPPLPDKGLPQAAELERIVRRALARDREERYPSAAAFARELEGYLASTGQLASRLKLGEWMATTFGTAIVEKRRASERRLPKSVPPPRSSERVRTGTPAAGVPALPAAPPLPKEAASGVVPAASQASEPPPETPRSSPPQLVSDGAMRAFKRELEEPRVVVPEPGSLAGAAMDVAPSSREPVDPSATGRASAPSIEAPLAKRSGTLVLVTVLAALAALVALARLLVR